MALMTPGVLALALFSAVPPPGDEKAPATPLGFPVQDLKTAKNERQRFFLMGPKEGAKKPKDGFGLVVVLPGGTGGEDFKGFVQNIYEEALSDDWLVAQLVSVKWTDDQTTIWPSDKLRVPKMEFTTEEFVEAAVADVSKKHPIDRSRIFVLAWSSGGPAAYSLSLQKKKSPTGFFIAMAVFRREWMGSLDEAKGEAYFLFQSPDDEKTAFSHAEDALKTLKAEGAKVELLSYPGGHGWHGNVYGSLRQGFSWLEKNKSKPGKP